MVFLVACDLPTPHFRGIAPVRVSVAGSDFEVRRRGRLAEAIRTNVEYAPRLGRIGVKAEMAIERATGCKVREIRGDAAVILAKLKC